MELRVCASCEWIFRNANTCPKCGFASYNAKTTYGKKCYTYERTQKPWMEKKMTQHKMKLLKEIEDSKKITKPERRIQL